MKTAWTVLISILILLVGPGFCRSDTLYLKDGSVINSESVWQEGGYYMYTMYGATIGISKTRVDRVEHSQKEENSFQFHIWPFGITTVKAITIAEKNDIPLIAGGFVSPRKHFSPAVKKHSDTDHFYYNTDLLEHFAKVDLFFTPISRELHTVGIKWVNHKQRDPRFTDEILSMISEKYGNCDKKAKGPLFTDFEWVTEKGNKIRMKLASRSIRLTYVETVLKQKEFEELERIKAERLKRGFEKDKKKF